FSSRRRHTRFSRDWSSDVCSSDLILTNDEAIAKKVNSAIFPGMQGGPLMHVIAGKAAAFGEALTPAFKAYSAAVVENAKVLAERSEERRVGKEWGWGWGGWRGRER